MELILLNLNAGLTFLSHLNFILLVSTCLSSVIQQIGQCFWFHAIYKCNKPDFWICAESGERQGGMSGNKPGLWIWTVREKTWLHTPALPLGWVPFLSHPQFVIFTMEGLGPRAGHPTTPHNSILILLN